MEGVAAPGQAEEYHKATWSRAGGMVGMPIRTKKKKAGHPPHRASMTACSGPTARCTQCYAPSRASPLYIMNSHRKMYGRVVGGVCFDSLGHCADGPHIDHFRRPKKHLRGMGLGWVR